MNLAFSSVEDGHVVRSARGVTSVEVV